MTRFEAMLAGGKPNSLGRTEEAVAITLRNESTLDELFDSLRSDDELVRLRVGDAIEKVARERPDWFTGRRFKRAVAMGRVNQPSLQWHAAQILAEIELTPAQRKAAISELWRMLTESNDWIVLQHAMIGLAGWAKDDSALRRRLVPELRRRQSDSRNSVARRATKLLAELGC